MGPMLDGSTQGPVPAPTSVTSQPARAAAIAVFCTRESPVMPLATTTAKRGRRPSGVMSESSRETTNIRVPKRPARHTRRIELWAWTTYVKTTNRGSGELARRGARWNRDAPSP